jgi:hypothetical protein
MITIMKKSIWIMLALILLVAALPLTSHAAPLLKLSWRAEYYDNDSLSGAPKLVIYDAVVSHDWGHGSPALEIPRDYFSARWTTTRHFEQGTYLFLLNVDDGARVWLDGALIIDAWDFGYKKRQAEIYIDKTGDHELQIAYFEKTGKAQIHFEWIQLGGEDDIVGSWRGQYFTNRDLAGEPVVTRQDGAINFDWNSGSPDPKITRDNFSVRWTRSIYLREGLYTFRIQHDDGMRAYVDGKIFYDSWYDQSVTYQTRTVPLKGGYRTFVIEYYDHIGNAIAQLSFDGDPDGHGDDEPDPNGAAIIVDNDSSRFTWGGPNGNRYLGPGGYGSSFWTYNTTSNPINFGQWTPPIAAAGNYEVFAFIPGSNATTTAARYRVCHYGEQQSRVLNQNSYHNEWVSLGTYYFKGGGNNECVTLYDATGEAANSTKIAFDAMKFVKR